MSNSHSFSSSQAARTSPERQFARYVLPSMFTMLLTGFYAIVDGFFIGRATGDVGWRPSTSPGLSLPSSWQPAPA